MNEDYRIENLIITWMVAGKPFTSLDVTNELKQQGMQIRNRVVARYLRDNFLMLSSGRGLPYNATLINVDSKADGMTMAYLYHHMDTPADSYMDRDQNPQSWQKAPAPSTAPGIGRLIRTLGDVSVPTQPDDLETADELLTKLRAARESVIGGPRLPRSSQRSAEGWKTQKRDALGRWIKQ